MYTGGHLVALLGDEEEVEVVPPRDRVVDHCARRRVEKLPLQEGYVINSDGLRNQ
jgi:hypothetical protein